MRAFMILCLIASTASQYDYNPHQSEALFAPNDREVTRGEALLSEPIQPSKEYSKQFFSYTAPESEFDDINAGEQLARGLKKALRVVFIKGPENTGLENAAIQLAKSASDTETAIYVLNKQADISSLTNQLNALRNGNTNKPEVHFVKYRTLADAMNAQRAIHAEYESLPGISSSSDDIDVPVLDFASTTFTPTSSKKIPQASYLPPSESFELLGKI